MTKAKNTVPAKTFAVAVGDVRIRRDRYGRYSLNDLHQAAGGAPKHQPAFFMRRKETQALISEIKNSAESQNLPVSIIKGRAGGTYVVKELVYAYATWISPAFHVKVIRTYDAVVSGLHVSGLSLHQQALLAERREKDSAQLASVGSALMHERRRDKPILQAALKRVANELQAQLQLEVTVKLARETRELDIKHGKKAANDSEVVTPRKRVVH